MGNTCCICESTIPALTKSRPTPLLNSTFVEKVDFEPTFGSNEYCALFKLIQSDKFLMQCIEIPTVAINHVRAFNFQNHCPNHFQNHDLLSIQVRLCSESLLQSTNRDIQLWINQITHTLIKHEKSFVHLFNIGKLNTPTFSDAIREIIDVLDIVVQYLVASLKNIIAQKKEYVIMSKWSALHTTKSPCLYRCEIQNGLTTSLFPLKTTDKFTTTTDLNIIPGFVREELDEWINSKLMPLIYFLQLEHVSVLHVDILVINGACELFDISVPQSTRHCS